MCCTAFDDLSNLLSSKCKDNFVQITDKLRGRKAIIVLKTKTTVISTPIRNFIISTAHFMLNVGFYCQIPESQIGNKPQLSKI